MADKEGKLSSPSTEPVVGPAYLIRWRFHVFASLVFLFMVAVWNFDGYSINAYTESRRFDEEGRAMAPKLNADNATDHIQNTLTQVIYPTNELSSSNSTSANAANHVIHPGLGFDLQNVSSKPNDAGAAQPTTGFSLVFENDAARTDWVSAELVSNLTGSLLARWLAPGGEPCRDSHSVDIIVPDLDGRDLIELPAGDRHEFRFRAVDESGEARCLGGDYFETDLSGKQWKSRPLIKDFGNGSYSMLLQVHHNFTGDYDLTMILLFRRFEGLKFSPKRFAFDKELRKYRVRFVSSKTHLPDLRTCRASDFDRGVWTGRWTRHGENNSCEISDDGRYRCLPANFPCRRSWCRGFLGMIESNGWVYSSHCSYRIFTGRAAWDCLKNRWVFFWGDSNHVDSIRNMLNFVLGLPGIVSVPRRFDMNFSNPEDATQWVRITNIFNGHYNETQNYQGLNSLRHEGFRNLVNKYFQEEPTVPDTIIMNSGLHDGVFWSNIRAFSAGADYAASFWKDVMNSVRRRGLVAPRIFYRTTIATGGYARLLAFNPSKMEAFNWVVLEKFRRAGLITGVIDNFDLTYPFHFDNRGNDGVHYGRAPAKSRWTDGGTGHQYFVDLMLAHVYLNAICPISPP